MKSWGKNWFQYKNISGGLQYLKTFAENVLQLLRQYLAIFYSAFLKNIHTGFEGVSLLSWGETWTWKLDWTVKDEIISVWVTCHLYCCPVTWKCRLLCCSDVSDLKRRNRIWVNAKLPDGSSIFFFAKAMMDLLFNQQSPLQTLIHPDANWEAGIEKGTKLELDLKTWGSGGVEEEAVGGDGGFWAIRQWVSHAVQEHLVSL